MLYLPESHTTAIGTRWREPDVRDAVAAIVAQADDAYGGGDLWPAHEWDGFRAALPLKNLYVGGAGMAWALDRLRPYAETRLDPVDVARRALERFREEPDTMVGEDSPQRASSLFCGEAGVVLVSLLLDPDDAHDADLHGLVLANLGNEVDDAMWGVPGTLLAARELLARTGAMHWVEAVRASEDDLRSRRNADGTWTQHLWGQSFEGLSAIHGLVGNALALEEPGDAANVLRDRATVEAEHANWFGAEWKLQWCDGAPGIVTHASTYLDEDVLLAAARLIWDAGPLVDEKGAGICHGTAGNGYALLKTFERTNDELWLERARAFAVHALEQARRLPGRYSLFTGGVGAAIFACDCLEARARYPIFDGFGT